MRFQEGEKIITKILNLNSNKDLIRTAFDILESKTPEKKEILHALNVALILSKLELDSNTISAALLHDILDNQPDSLRKKIIDEISKKLNPDISFLVERCFAVQKIYLPLSIVESFKRKKLKVENLRKMFVALAEDLRVILITLASRLERLRNLKISNSMTKQEKILYGFESLEILVPVADRIGATKIKLEMEDLAFSLSYPKEFKWLKEKIEKARKKRSKYLEKFKKNLINLLKEEGIKLIDIKERTKSFWSYWQKLLKNNMDFSKIYDLIGIQLILEDIKSCYKTLALLNKKYTPVFRRTKDYISKPTKYGYKSLHTTIILKEKIPIEIQIKTKEMFFYQTLKIHWLYKEDINIEKDPKYKEWDPLFKKLKSIFSQDKELDKIDKKNFKIDIFKNKVFVFTPKGEVISLPSGSTPVDFAYAIHTDIGNHCSGCKINQKISPLETVLKNGDTVEILVDKKKKPSRDWLRFVKTSLAKNQIKKFFKEYEISEPKTKLEKGRLKEKTTQVLNKNKINQNYKILLTGTNIKVPTNIARCCNPKFGDEIVGYLTLYKGLVIHKKNCQNLLNLVKKFPRRVFKVNWASKSEIKNLNVISIEILAKDRIGLLGDIAKIISSAGYNILEHKGTLPKRNGQTEIFLKIEKKPKADFQKTLNLLKKVKGVVKIKVE